MTFLVAFLLLPLLPTAHAAINSVELGDLIYECVHKKKQGLILDELSGHKIALAKVLCLTLTDEHFFFSNT